MYVHTYAHARNSTYYVLGRMIIFWLLKKMHESMAMYVHFVTIKNMYVYIYMSDRYGICICEYV